jgi:hypothetical protein
MIIGVDPGLDGCVTLCDLTAPPFKVLRFIDLKDFALDGLPDAERLYQELRPLKAELAVLERPSAMPANRQDYRAVGNEVKGQGVASAFNFGQTCGLMWGLLAATTPKVYRPHPAAWKAAMGLPAEKRPCVERAAKEFPGNAHEFYGPKRGLLHGRAEAALLALFGRRFAAPPVAIRPTLNLPPAVFRAVAMLTVRMGLSSAREWIAEHFQVARVRDIPEARHQEFIAKVHAL